LNGGKDFAGEIESLLALEAARTDLDMKYAALCIKRTNFPAVF